MYLQPGFLYQDLWSGGAEGCVNPTIPPDFLPPKGSNILWQHRKSPKPLWSSQKPTCKWFLGVMEYQRGEAAFEELTAVSITLDSKKWLIKPSPLVPAARHRKDHICLEKHRANCWKKSPFLLNCRSSQELGLLFPPLLIPQGEGSAASSLHIQHSTHGFSPCAPQ